MTSRRVCVDAAPHLMHWFVQDLAVEDIQIQPMRPFFMLITFATQDSADAAVKQSGRRIEGHPRRVAYCEEAETENINMFLESILDSL